LNTDFGIKNEGKNCKIDPVRWVLVGGGGVNTVCVLYILNMKQKNGGGEKVVGGTNITKAYCKHGQKCHMNPLYN
jgi:hypothetical protein